MHLDLVHVDGIGANGHQHLLTVTGSVSAVGGRQVIGVRAVLLQERIIREIGGVSTSCQNDNTVRGVSFAVVLVRHTGDLVSGLVDAGDTGLLEELHPMRLGLRQLLYSLHESVGDGHTGEFGIMATVRTGEGVASEQHNHHQHQRMPLGRQNGENENYSPQTGHQSQVQVEDVLQPFDGRGRLVGEDLDQLWTSLVSGGLESILVELLDTVLDAQIRLGARESAVDTGRGLGGIASEEV